MKKTKFLTFILVLAIAIMGAGYAYWTQVLEINGTVHTGSLDVQFIPSDSWAKAYESEQVQNFLKSKGLKYEDTDYTTVEVDPDNTDEIGFIINKIYPGSGGFLSFAIINKGTVPAKLANIQVTKLDGLGGDEQGRFNYLVSNVTKYDAKAITKLDINIDTDCTEINDLIRTYLLNHIEDIAEGSELEYRTTHGKAKVAKTFNEFVAALQSNLEGITLNPGEMVVIDEIGTFLGIDWSYLLEKDEYEEFLKTGYSVYLPTSVSDFQNTNVEFDFQLNFEQHTN